ncbi:hypothetical protein MMPV_003473 [Pyropia vietnamensis]
MAVKQAVLTTLASLLLLTLTVTTTSAAPTLAPTHKLNAIESLNGVREAPSLSVEDASVNDDQAAVNTLSRTEQDADAECHWVWAKACYTKDGKKYCKKVWVEVCGAEYSGSTARTAAESPKDASTVNDDHAAVNTLLRTEQDADAECHWVWVNACYTKDGKKYCKKVWVEVCGAEYSGSTARTAAESPKDASTVNDDHAAVNTLLRTEQDADAECHWVWVNACYTKDGKKYCKKVWVEVCGAEYSGSTARTAAESPKDASTVNDDHAAVNTLLRTEQDADAECHWVWVNACYTKDGKKYCKKVSVKVCGASSQ